MIIFYLKSVLGYAQSSAVLSLGFLEGQEALQVHSPVIQIVSYTGCNDKKINTLGYCIAASFHFIFLPAMLTCNHKDCRRGLCESRIKQISPVRQKRFISGITSVVLGESLKSLRIRNGRVSKALKALPAESWQEWW